MPNPTSSLFISGAEGTRFRGSLDNVRIYNRALSSTEITELHNLEKPPANNSPPPNITSQPVADQNATIGSNINFNVEANGTGLTFQWQKRVSAIER